MSGLTRCFAVATAALLALNAAPAHAASSASADVTVRGTVSNGGHLLAGVRVGTWNPTRGTIATTVTDSHGAFALRSAAGIPIEVWAGTDPRAARAVFRLGDQHLVRGVIGRSAVTGVAGPLWQRVDPVAPGRLDAGRPIHLRLQSAGRFTSPVAQGGAGSVTLVRGQDTSDVFEADGGRVSSGWLVPGTYRLRWDADSGHLPVTTTLRLGPGSTDVTAPVLPAGTTVRIRALSDGTEVAPGVHAVEVGDREDQDAGATDSSGTITLHGVTPGRHTYVVGRGAPGPDGAPEVPLTDDRYLPASVTVIVRRGQADARATVRLAPASRIAGHVAQPEHHRVLVIAETAEGVPVRVASATKGAYALGGLQPGTYRLIAEDSCTGRYTERRIVLTGGASDVEMTPLIPTTSEPLLTGRLADAGSVLLRSAIDLRVFRREVQSDHIGRFRIRIFPGRFIPVTFVDGRDQAIARPLTVSASTVVRLASGSRPAAARGRGRIHGGIVPITPDLVGPRTIDEEFGGAARYADTYPTTGEGTAFVGTNLPAGTYRLGALNGSVPVQDGPWHYETQRSSFHLAADRTTDIGIVRLSIRG